MHIVTFLYMSIVISKGSVYILLYHFFLLKNYIHPYNQAFQYFGHLMQRADSLEKAMMLGKIEGTMRRGWQRTRWLNGSTDSMTMSLSSRRWWRTGKPGMLQSMGSQRVRHDWVTEQQYYRTRGYKKKSCSGQEGEPCTLAHLNPILSSPVGQGTQGGKVWDTCC